jgi:adenylate cyclase
MSGDTEQEYFADGITEDILTALSRSKWLLVIARNSSFVFKGRAVDVKDVGEKLGVRYVLEGSVRKAGNRVRITGQLIEATTAAHIWAEKYDRDFTDIFELQDEIVQHVVAAIEPSIRSREIERVRSKPTESLDAYDLFLRALPEFQSFTEQGYRAAERLLRRALTLDPAYSDAWAALADCLGRLHVGGWAEDSNLSREATQHAALAAVRSDPENGTALAIASWAHAILLRRMDQAIEYADRAIRLQPNSVYVRSHCGWALVFAGQGERALAHFEAARLLSPIDPLAYTTFCGMAACHFFSERFEEAARWATRARDQGPTFPVALRFLAASLGHLGRIDDARAVVQNLLTVQPNANLARARESNFATPAMVSLYVRGLAQAGLPE